MILSSKFRASRVVSFKLQAVGIQAYKEVLYVFSVQECRFQGAGLSEEPMRTSCMRRSDMVNVGKIGLDKPQKVKGYLLSP